jgi:hypothetical protein
MKEQEVLVSVFGVPTTTEHRSQALSIESACSVTVLLIGLIKVQEIKFWIWF